MNKVLHIIAGLNDGGAEATLFRLCSHAKGIEHTVVAFLGEGKYTPLLEQAGVKVIHLEQQRGHFSLAAFVRLYKLIKAIQPDAVQTWMYHADLIGGLAARFAGIKNICWGIHHTSLEAETTKSGTIWVARVSAWLSSWLPKTIICCAEQSAKSHRAMGYQAKKLRVVPNGYNLLDFYLNLESRDLIRQELGIDNSTLLLGMVGRFDPLKDHKNLLNAIGRVQKSLPELACLLVGPDMTPANGDLQQLIDQSGAKNLYLLGQRPDIPAIMNALDLHVLSSCSEAFPNVLAEAMACGTPCISTQVGDAAEILGPTGWLVPIRESQTLSTAILKALHEKQTQPEQWAERQSQCRQRIEENFSIEKMVSRYRQSWDI